MKYKSRNAAIENLKRFFANTPTDDITLVEAFTGWGRPNPENVEANKPWLSSELVHFKYHNLLAPVYAYSDGRKKLVKLRLTLEGKKALGRLVSDPEEDKETTANSINTASLSDVARIVADFKAQHKEYEITFDVKLRNDA